MAGKGHYRKAEEQTPLAVSSDSAAEAQIHATLAVADQLARVAEALEKLIQVQQER